MRLAFKKKSYALHPDRFEISSSTRFIKFKHYINRHPGNPSAFANFINVNEAFVEIIKDFESRAMQSGSEVRK